MDNRRVYGIQFQQSSAEEIGCISHQNPYRHHHNLADHQDIENTLVFPGAVILAAEADGCLMKGIHGSVHKALDITGRRISRHGHGAEAVHRGLNQYIGDGKQSALHSCGNADLHHFYQLVRRNLHALQHQAVGTVSLNQTPHHQSGGDGLGSHRGRGNSSHPHGKHNHKDQIQHHIHHTCDQQVIQGSLGVAYSPEHSASEIIYHHKRHTGKIDPHVQNGMLDYILRCSHQAQSRTGDKKPQKNQNHTSCKGCGNGCLHHFLQFSVLPRPIKSGHQNICPHRQSDEQIHDQICQGAGGTHRRQSLISRKTSYYHNVRRIEKQLQNSRQHQRYVKNHNLTQQRTVTHVYFVFF